MAKASAAAFAACKRRALRAIAQQAPDSFVPDRVIFFNDDVGFAVRLSDLGEDNHVQKLVPWLLVDLAASDNVVEDTVSRAVEQLARVQFA